MLSCCELTLEILVQGQHPHTSADDAQRIGEHGANTDVLRHVEERGPAGQGAGVETWCMHGSSVVVCVLARALTHGELHVLQGGHPLTRHAHGAGLAATHHGDPCTGDPEHVGADAAQARRRRSGQPAGEGHGESGRAINPVHVQRPGIAWHASTLIMQATFWQSGRHGLGRTWRCDGQMPMVADATRRRPSDGDQAHAPGSVTGPLQPTRGMPAPNLGRWLRPNVAEQSEERGHADHRVARRTNVLPPTCR